MKKYIRTKEGNVYQRFFIDQCLNKTMSTIKDGEIVPVGEHVIAEADAVEKLCDCFVKIKRKKNCKDYILKYDYRDLATLKEQAIKYPESPVYGAIHVEDKGLIYVIKLSKGEWVLL